MTTLYDVDGIERQNAHMEGEIRDAKRILQEYRQNHDDKQLGRCRCSTCAQCDAWLKRNK